jgi:hypothetical protein
MTRKIKFSMESQFHGDVLKAHATHAHYYLLLKFKTKKFFLFFAVFTLAHNIFLLVQIDETFYGGLVTCLRCYDNNIFDNEDILRCYLRRKYKK